MSEKGGKWQECESCRDVYAGSCSSRLGTCLVLCVCDFMEGALTQHVESSICVLVLLLSSQLIPEKLLNFLSFPDSSCIKSRIIV